MMIKSVTLILFLATSKLASAQLRSSQRKLDDLVLPATFLGQNLPFPLGACQGECMDDSDCVAGLTCTSRSPGDIVRGCSLDLELLFSSVNLCVLNATHDNPQPARSPVASFQASSGNEEPVDEVIPTPPVNPSAPTPLSAPVNPPVPVVAPVSAPTPGISSDVDAVYVGNGVNVNLGLCEGDCDADSNCAAGLGCFQRSAGQDIPGCRLSADLAASDFDFCYDPSPSGPVSPPALTPAEFVGNGVNQDLSLCQGDCDSDANCAGDLICYQRSEGDEVPGCLLSADLLVSSFDFCTEASFTFAPTRSPVRPSPPVNPIIPTAPVPVAPPLQPPITAPVPVAPPLPAPVPVMPPLQPPVPAPIAAPTPVAPAPITNPIQTPVISPSVPTPAANPIQMPIVSPIQGPTMPAANPISMPVPTPVQAPGPSTPVALPTMFRPTAHPTRPRSIDWTRPTPHPTRPRSVDWPRPTPHPTRPRSLDWPAPTSNPTTPVAGAELISNVDKAVMGLCQGDCDTNEDCLGDLICYQREIGDPMPDCILSAELKHTNIDFCVPGIQAAATWEADEVNEEPASDTTFAANSVPQTENETAVISSVTANSEPFALKLYWEEGYYWQYESYERKWCVGCQSGCTPGNNVAIYNCDDARELWTFVEYDDGSAQIQNYDWELCLQTSGQDQVVLAVCDATVMEQRFVALGGSFDYYRFELSPLLKPGLCFTQDHHPKMDEMLFLDKCSKARHDTTSFWNKY